MDSQNKSRAQWGDEQQQPSYILYQRTAVCICLPTTSSSEDTQGLSWNEL